MTTSNDVPMSNWIPLQKNPPAPREPGLIEVRATINGKPVVMEYPKANDPEGILYIKACDDIWFFTRWLYASLTHPELKQHPAAIAYREINLAEEMYPIEGLQFRYVTESQLQEIENG